MRNAAYEGLFYRLATAHQLIRHRDSAPRFARLILSVDPLQRLADMAEMDELLTSRYLTAESGQFVLVLESLQTQVQGNEGDNYQHRRLGAFFVLGQAPTARDAWSVLDQTEIVGAQLLGAVRHAWQDDPRTRLVVGSVKFDAVGPVGDGTWYGTRFDFEFFTPATAALAYNPVVFDPY